MAEMVYKRLYNFSSRDYRDGQMAANLEEEFSTSVNTEEHTKSMLTGLITAEWMPPRILAGPPPVLSDLITSGVKRKEGRRPRQCDTCCYLT